jgi:hypothetical protein
MTFSPLGGEDSGHAENGSLPTGRRMHQAAPDPVCEKHRRFAGVSQALRPLMTFPSHLVVSEKSPRRQGIFNQFAPRSLTGMQFLIAIMQDHQAKDIRKAHPEHQWPEEKGHGPDP